MMKACPRSPGAIPEHLWIPGRGLGSHAQAAPQASSPRSTFRWQHLYLGIQPVLQGPPVLLLQEACTIQAAGEPCPRLIPMGPRGPRAAQAA